MRKVFNNYADDKELMIIIGIGKKSVIAIIGARFSHGNFNLDIIMSILKVRITPEALSTIDFKMNPRYNLSAQEESVEKMDTIEYNLVELHEQLQTVRTHSYTIKPIPEDDYKIESLLKKSHDLGSQMKELQVELNKNVGNI